MAYMNPDGNTYTIANITESTSAHTGTLVSQTYMQLSNANPENENHSPQRQ
jgi:hypothetical protein